MLFKNTFDDVKLKGISCKRSLKLKVVMKGCNVNVVLWGNLLNRKNIL